jgi:amino acid transporter
VNLAWAALIVAAVGAVAVTVMLLVRRRAPEGSYFEDGDRAAGVFGVLATGFAVLLGFVVFLAFESFDTSRSGAETEAEVVEQQFETAQLMPAAVRGRFSGELLCYARSVVHQEWPQMESGTLTDGYNPWTIAMFRTLKTVEPSSASQQAAYAKWLDQRTDRESARADRTHGAEGVIPTPLWIVLFLTAGIIFFFMLFFADSAERAIVQATIMGSVAIVITSTLLLLWFLNNPYHRGSGGLRPSAMERTAARLESDTGIASERFEIPCDVQGRAS